MPEERVVERDDVALRTWTWPGGPPPTLLLHGIGNYGRYWDIFADAIAGRLRLIAPDARGHGESGKPEKGYAPSDFVADAIAVLDSYGLEKALVVGHSMGGSHAISLAAAHPNRVIGLVAVDVGVEAMPEGAERARRLSLERPERFASRAEAEEYLRRTSPGYSGAVYENRLRWLFREENGTLVWQSSSNALRGIMGARRNTDDRWRVWRSVSVPTLVVRGKRSMVLSADVARRMAAERPGVAMLELDAAHNIAFDRPLELADAVVDFARSLSARRVL